MKRLLLATIALYSRWLSPALHAIFPGGCGYRPTCSEYAVEAIQIWGPGRGGWLALKRLLRCNPFTRGGFDPVPFPPHRHHPSRSTATDPLP
jgi:hypothetical protein